MPDANLPILNLSPEKRFIDGGEFHPTLVIGLGGTGANVIRRLKRQLSLRYGQDTGLIRYLCIDTDSRTFANEPGLPDIQPSEACDIAMQMTDALTIKNDIKRGHHKEMKKWLSPDMSVKMLSGMGAGTIRACGRFCLYSHFDNILGSLQNAKNDILDLNTRIETVLGASSAKITINPEPIIYIVSSCCGGSGAGMLIDIAVMVQELFKNRLPQIKGILTMPSVYEKDAKRNTGSSSLRHQANAVASLSELQTLMDEEEITSGKWEFEYPNDAMRMTVPVSPIFSQCFLIESKNEHGEMLKSKEDVFEMIARALTQDFSPIGSQVGSNQADLYAAGLLEPCKETGKSRNFHTFSVTSLVLPTDTLLKYCCESTAIEVLNHLKGKPHDVSSNVKDFLTTSQLNEFDPSNQIIDLLRTKIEDTGITKLDHNKYTVTESELNSSKGKEIEIIEKKEKECNDFIVDILTPLVRKNRDLLEGIGNATTVQLSNGISNKKSLISNSIATEIEKNGWTGAYNWLNQLSSDLNAMCRELELESKVWADEKWEIGYKKVKEPYSRTFVMGAPEHELASTHNKGMEQQVLEIIRQAAISLLVNLIKWVDDQRRIIIDFPTILQKIEKEFIDSRSSIEASRESYLSTISSGYTLEQVLSSPKDLTLFFQKNKADAVLIFKNLIKKFLNPVDIFNVNSNKDLKNSLLAFCKSQYEPCINETSVIDMLTLQSEAGDAKEILKSKLDILLGYCQPFWQMRAPGDMKFTQSILIGVPVPIASDGGTDPGLGVIEMVNEWLDKTVKANQDRPAPIRTGYPFSLEVARRVYGALPYYHSEWKTWKKNYQDLLKNESVMPLHIHKDYFLTLPDIEPVLPENILFALSIAFGFVAKTVRSFVFGIEMPSTDAGVPNPIYKSSFKTISLNTKSAKPVKLKIKVDDSSILVVGNSRNEAMKKFIQLSKISKEALEALEILRGKTKYLSIIKEYHEKIKNDALAEKDLSLRKQLEFEQRCIEKELFNLR